MHIVNLQEKLTITVKLCFIETRLKKKNYDLQDFFKNNKRNDKHFNNCGYSLFFLMNII